ncbi:30S ribosome-binding factor RbfA [uncultured Clostridium sp.]|uniref:30S ribosome-binding factor RbfA n=1 Tax=uncultured Clostridium sp. TaxID=59620 RepID=UPI0025D50C2D|nr:30S ribosome-binding factor RbfA [uncultured Clostridium sp.]
MPSYRGGRINEEVKREISNLIRNDIKDVRLTAMISVTAVKVTKDLRYAKVYVSIFAKSEEEKNTNLEVLKSAAGFVRREIAQRINLRHSPQILFELDDSIDYGMKIDSLIEQAKVRK